MGQNVISSSDDHFLDSRSIPRDLDTAHLYLNVTNLQRSCKRLDYLRKEIERKEKKKAQQEKKKKCSLVDNKKFKAIKEEYRELYNEILVQRVEVDSLFDTPRRRPNENEDYRNHRLSESERHRPKSRQSLPQLDKEECEKCREKTKTIWQLEANINRNLTLNQFNYLIAYKKENERLQNDITSLNAEIDRERCDKQINRTNSSARNLQHRIDELEALIVKERFEKEDALRRLSSMASAKLRDNIPNIANISDPNRPTKIAETLSEIYDNEWTDAFDHLEKYYSKEEKDNVQLLLDVLIKVHQKCNNLSENILNNIIGPMPTDIPPDVSKNLKDAIKMCIPHRISALAKDIKSSLQSQIKIKPGDPFDIYVDRCIEACLLMSVQDPPMYLSAYPDKDGLFSHTLYRAYTKSGKYELFIVWPVLYLHKNGPMMAKGVAQGTDDYTMIKNNYSLTYQQPVQSQTVVEHHYDYQQRPQQHHHEYKQDWHQYGGMRTSYMSSAYQRQQQYQLSSPASNMLRDNDPNSVDLSDPHRPTKLSEQFSEIYDNEWTDALDELQKILGDKEDKEVISYLLGLLLEINSACSSLSASKLNEIQMQFVHPAKPSDENKVPAELFKTIKDALKSTAPKYIKDVQVHVHSHLKKWLPLKSLEGCLESGNVKRYIDKCADVCWYMSVQDPQLFMEGDQSPEGKFDSSKYREFTKKGPYEEFVVWPVLYLYRGGPMLSKGVAQGSKLKDKISGKD